MAQATSTPTPEQVLKVLQTPEDQLPFLLINGAWAAIDVARRLPGRVGWRDVQPVLEQMERWGQIARVQVKGTRLPRYRLLGD